MGKFRVHLTLTSGPGFPWETAGPTQVQKDLRGRGSPVPQSLPRACQSRVLSGKTQQPSSAQQQVSWVSWTMLPGDSKPTEATPTRERPQAPPQRAPPPHVLFWSSPEPTTSSVQTLPGPSRVLTPLKPKKFVPQSSTNVGVSLSGISPDPHAPILPQRSQTLDFHKSSFFFFFFQLRNITV